MVPFNRSKIITWENLYNEFVNLLSLSFVGFVLSGKLHSLQAYDSCVIECITGILSYVVVNYTKTTIVVDLCISSSDAGRLSRICMFVHLVRAS